MAQSLFLEFVCLIEVVELILVKELLRLEILSESLAFYVEKWDLNCWSGNVWLGRVEDSIDEVGHIGVLATIDVSEVFIDSARHESVSD